MSFSNPTTIPDSDPRIQSLKRRSEALSASETIFLDSLLGFLIWIAPDTTWKPLHAMLELRASILRVVQQIESVNRSTNDNYKERLKECEYSIWEIVKYCVAEVGPKGDRVLLEGQLQEHFMQLRDSARTLEDEAILYEAFLTEVARTMTTAC